jgi:SPP1 gp7 family putative phage head morphogenesis protein
MSIVGPQVEVASVVARGKNLLFRKFDRSAARYAGDVGEDLRFQLAVGVARGETFGQLVTRLQKLGGPKVHATTRGGVNVFEHISDGIFARYKYMAERVVRTEMMHAYNRIHEDAIRQANADRPKGDPEYIRRWDATRDGRVCTECRWLDGAQAPIGKDFKGGYDGPPAHPNCRCVVLAWRVDWPDLGPLPR